MSSEDLGHVDASESSLLFSALLSSPGQTPNKADMAKASFQAFQNALGVSLETIGEIVDVEGGKVFVRHAPGVWSLRSLEDREGTNLFPLPEELSQAMEESYLDMLEVSSGAIPEEIPPPGPENEVIRGGDLHIPFFESLIARIRNH